MLRFNLKKYFWIGVILIVSIIPLMDLLQPGIPVTHDGRDHVARIANFYQNITEGNVVPRWAENLNWGYGHPILMFLYPLPSYSASLAHFLGADYVDSLKIVFALSFILSGVAMYLWVREFLGEEGGALAGGLFMFAPYRFVDLYVRGAIGEHVAFIFPPLILYFMLKLTQKYSFKNFALGSLSVAGLILSHNAITIMFVPFIIGYGILLVVKSKNKQRVTIRLISSILLGAGLSSFFLIPAFFEGKYTLRDIVTANEYALRFINPMGLIYSPWNYGGTGQFSVQIGFAQIALLLVSFFSLKKISLKNKELKTVYFLALGLFVLSLFIMTRESNFIWGIFTILQKFQFPWRFLSVVVFTSSILGAFTVLLFSQKRKAIFVFVILAALIFINRNYYQAQGFLVKPENFYTSVYDSTTDTGESSPIWSVRFMEKRPKGKLQVISGNAEFKEISRTTTNHIYLINVLSDNARIRENTLYFPGWNVYVGNKKLEIEFQDPTNRGVITFFLPKGLSKVELKFEDTNLRKFSNAVSLVSIAGIFVIGVMFKKNELS